MLTGKATSRIFLILLLAGFLLGVFRLFSLRFESGDIYPPYSSLRKDPLGTGVFHRSLERMENISVERNYEPWSLFPPEKEGVLILPGVSKYFLAAGIPKRLETFVATGGRLVATFYPELAEEEKNGVPTPTEGNGDNSAEAQESRTREEATRDEGNESEGNRESRLEGGPFYGIGIDRFASGSEKPEAFSTRNAPPALPKSLDWPSDIHFAVSGKQWNVIYEKGERPVLLEGKYGGGTIVLASDSFFLSNEGLSKETNAALLVWLVGGNRNVVFDEYSHGVRKDYGIVDLALKYRLHGLGAGLLLFAALLVWKLGARLVPASAYDEVDAENFFRGEQFRRPFEKGDGETALTLILRRAIPEKKILQACIGEWKKSAASDNDRLVRMEKACAGLTARAGGKNSGIDPVSGYNIISRSLSEDSSE